MQEIRELHAGGDDACYTMLNPGTGAPVDMNRRLSAETSKADHEHLVALIKSASTAPQAPVPLDAVERDFEIVVTAMTDHFGAEVVMLNEPKSALKERRRYCELAAFMIDRLHDMPPQQGGRVYRALAWVGSPK